ncbi:hypothetical protein JXB37_07985 [candidate division WOR-3 bacterium]|nr:hypothetical protein [candidate division WOR-3 bacterium]
MLKVVLFANGVVDLVIGLALVVMPALGLRVPGWPVLGSEAVFIAGGWGLGIIVLGAGRVWAAFAPRYHWMWNVLGIIEAAPLALYALVRVVFTPTTMGQAALPLYLGAVFAVLYILALVRNRAVVPKPASD